MKHSHLSWLLLSRIDLLYGQLQGRMVMAVLNVENSERKKERIDTPLYTIDRWQSEWVCMIQSKSFLNLHRDEKYFH